MASRHSLKVSVPGPDADKPNVARVGAIALACFAVGVAWPTLAGVDFAPRPPGSTPKDSGEQAALPAAPTQSATQQQLPAVAKTAPALTTEESVIITETVVVSCGNVATDHGKGCDIPAVETAVKGPIERLAQCEAAAGASGILSLGLELDFEKGHVTHVKSGKSTTFSNERAEAMLACADSTVVGTPLTDITHQHRRYWVYVLTQLVPPGSPIVETLTPAEPQIVPTSGHATVGWKTAIVRESPDRESKVQARLLYGTRVRVTGRLGEWYRVEIEGQDAGWVDHQAIGL